LAKRNELPPIAVVRRALNEARHDRDRELAKANREKALPSAARSRAWDTPASADRAKESRSTLPFFGLRGARHKVLGAMDCHRKEKYDLQLRLSLLMTSLFWSYSSWT
jgi:hypothetical protein